MRVSDVFRLGNGSGYDHGDSYDNFGCSAGDCYAGDYGRYSYYYWTHAGWEGGYGGRYVGGLRNESASRGDGYNRVQG
ncbi:MAG: hypothetical protein WAN20_04965 [Pseudonocardiaceae bacterium]|nr:hypothetical protein [Pseudonocardiaceae bacterium]